MPVVRGSTPLEGRHPLTSGVFVAAVGYRCGTDARRCACIGRITRSGRPTIRIGVHAMDEPTPRTGSWLSPSRADISTADEEIRHASPPIVAVVWGGTQAEADRLLLALHEHCAGGTSNAQRLACLDSIWDTGCAAHAMLDTQFSLDHALSVMRDRARFCQGEFRAGLAP